MGGGAGRARPCAATACQLVVVVGKVTADLTAGGLHTEGTRNGSECWHLINGDAQRLIVHHLNESPDLHPKILAEGRQENRLTELNEFRQ